MLEAQAGVCAICKGPPNGRTTRFHIDHDHQRKTVRGLLCMKCNRGIGYLKDNPDLLRVAATYLDRTMGNLEIKESRVR